MSQQTEFKQILEIVGQYMTVEIKSKYTKRFSETELILMAAQMLKAYSSIALKEDLDKILGNNNKGGLC